MFQQFFVDYLLCTIFNCLIQNLNCNNVVITTSLSFGTAYVNRLSNYPPVIVQQILLSVSSRILNISLKKSIFNNFIPMYENASKIVFYDHKIYSGVIESNNT